MRWRLVLLLVLLAAAAPAADGWVIFKGQVNGPQKDCQGLDLETFRLRNYEGMFYTEGYYHHLNFTDGSMITVNVGINHSEINLAFVYAKPGMDPPYRDFVILDRDDVTLAPSGFGITVGPNRVRLEGGKYLMDLALPKSKIHIELDPLGPSVSYGDNMVRYPDGDTFEYYSLPISWASATVDAVLDGKPLKLKGHGNMNHDAGVIFPTDLPANWQVFWFFGDDHALIVTDYFARAKFNKQPIQRLVFVTRDGTVFTSTDFELKWSDWVDAKPAPFHYPKNYTGRAEGGGAVLELEVRMSQVLLLEDLFSNLPTYLRLVIEQVTKNGWTLDSWSEYTLKYTHDGRTDTYHGKGVVRWCDLEEER